MHTEARVGVVVEYSRQRALSSGHEGGGVGDGKGTYSTLHKSQMPKQQLQHQPQIGTVEHLIAGGVAGAVSKTCTAPLSRLTILFQVQGMHSDVATLKNASIWREASRIVSEEGLRAFWKGNLVTIAHRLPYSSISFYTYERYKSLLQMIPGLDKHRDNVAADVCVRLFAGGLAGITAASSTYPLDLVRTCLAAQTRTMYYRGISHALYTICRDEVTFPLDLVRRRMQLEGAGGRAHVYTCGLIGTFKHIVRIKGIQGLYRGILPEYFKVVPSVGIVFMTYEALKMTLSSRSTDE